MSSLPSSLAPHRTFASSEPVCVIGGGLAGCEAAWQLVQRGIPVTLIEMKPARQSPAHTTPLLAELVCSNSLRSDDPATPAGLLKAELRAAGSLIIACADATRVPAGDALAVDRHQMSRLVTARLCQHPLFTLRRQLVDELPDGLCILAGGPLVDGGAAREIRRLCGDRLYFYDAIAPIVEADSLDWDRCFFASRQKRPRRGQPAPQPSGEGDYINCPMSRDEYFAFVEALLAGRKVSPHRFEEPRYFEGCLPIEVMAERGPDTLAFGPMKPVGLTDPSAAPDAERPYAIVQLRAENRFGTAYNLVGFQTRLAYPEQKRIFSLIPALKNAEFLRFGSIHRNSYVESHRVLDDSLALRDKPTLHLAGQITGVEGYIESTAIGLLVARFVDEKRRGQPISPPPVTTALGALYHHIHRPRQPGEPFVPMNINFGLLPALDDPAYPWASAKEAKKAGKHGRRTLHAARAQAHLPPWLSSWPRRPDPSSLRDEAA
ncbi:MAG: methylenetetrahydrofolate--tRNA-(uracil(54)-C(5))-methyltransferase (FADH(2)-oxidizing) TrmFO [Myxococcales bacterium]|nr:methylenetetrahydrofolate--tRNA-(uracil(54)-C(5))-methyltransferase (FADH(2)-oxidizing) TrmFO [Myxococcales bacterium]